ncbi:hypothetical protein DVH24_028638 [Malus domestica]|uniref:Uncharacterized protein n=1 Tax=Malus domestica TaxID=3750 RepID=A0A498IUS8_MALDO|nr:hypothetical protein DVH24_028638 [Malus domestica]
MNHFRLNNKLPRSNKFPPNKSLKYRGKVTGENLHLIQMKITKKPTKKCKTLKKEATQKKEHLQYRCNMIRLAEAMKVYNPMLQLRQDVCNDAKTPFWSLLKTYMDGTLITSERKRKSDMDFIKIINCYNPTTQKFKFGRHKGHGISSNDVAQIFGLNNEGINLPNTNKSRRSILQRHMRKHLR